MYITGYVSLMYCLVGFQLLEKLTKIWKHSRNGKQYCCAIHGDSHVEQQCILEGFESKSMIRNPTLNV